MEIADFHRSGPLGSLPLIRDVTRKRISSYDVTGGNKDKIILEPNEKKVIAEIEGAGRITHLWFTMKSRDKYYLRKVILRASWDKETQPSIEVPIGDFFGMGHSLTKNYWSLPFTMSPQDGKGFNCYFPMPFGNGAIFEIENECEHDFVDLYYYIDYEQHSRSDERLGRFHSQWRRTNPCRGIVQGKEMPTHEYLYSGLNKSGNDNYILLEAEGKGHFVGSNLNIYNLRQTDEDNWYGDGDDMIFIDGERWPPSLHGTGTEDYYNTAYCPSQEDSSPYHGIILGGGPNWSGRITLYRFHIEDPICFSKSIRVTIEHGHANRRSDDFSSTVYWYQTEPHKEFPRLLPVCQRIPY
jgi:hypothetical protein